MLVNLEKTEKPQNDIKVGLFEKVKTCVLL